MSLKQQTQKDLENIYDQLQNLGRINLINLEAALVELDDKKEHIASNVYQDARSGLERALMQYKAMLEFCDNMYIKLDQSVNKAVTDLVSALLDLAINENTEVIRLRIQGPILGKVCPKLYFFIRIPKVLYVKTELYLVW